MKSTILKYWTIAFEWSHSRVSSVALIIGHFRITFSLFLKASLGAFIWKWDFFDMQIKLIFIWKDEHQDSLWGRG